MNSYPLLDELVLYCNNRIAEADKQNRPTLLMLSAAFFKLAEIQSGRAVDEQFAILDKILKGMGMETKLKRE